MPDWIRHMRNLGRYMWLSGNCNEAVAIWQRSLTLDPYDVAAALGLLYADRSFENSGPSL